MKIVSGLLSIVLACGLAGCSASVSHIKNDSSVQSGVEEVHDHEAKEPQKTSPETVEDKAAEIVGNLSLEQKVAQMFIVRPESITGVDPTTAARETTKNALANYPVGGIIYFAHNLNDPDQTKELIANSQTYALEACGIPLFIAVDEEGGTVSRIASNANFGVENVGSMVYIGASGNTEQAKDVAVTIGSYLHELGFNLDLAPCADISGGTADTMYKRSFGSEANLVATMVKAQVEGFLSTGMLCCAKHFPGIGNVDGDSHDQSIFSYKTIDELQEWELVPFKAAIEADIPVIMVGHLSLPNAVGNDTPASINYDIITGLLRNELGYTGLVITDSMGMSAVRACCEDSLIGVEAIKAGADIVLMPADFAAAYQGVLDAVGSGEISEDRIDESVLRIVTTKLKYLEF